MSQRTYLFRLSFVVKGDKAKDKIKELLLDKLQKAKQEGVVESGSWRIIEEPLLAPRVEEGKI